MTPLPPRMAPSIETDLYWKFIWKQFKKHRLGVLGLFVVLAFSLVGVYAPILASSKPLMVKYEGEWFFPLFRYLFYPGFFTKKLDIFFNLLMFTIPGWLITVWMFKNHSFCRKASFFMMVCLQLGLFVYFIARPVRDPAANESSLQLSHKYDWSHEVEQLSPYAKLNLVLRYQQRKEQNERLVQMVNSNATETLPAPKITSLWQIEKENELYILNQEQYILKNTPEESAEHLAALEKIHYFQQKQNWLENQKLSFKVMPLLRHFHWEEDAGGDKNLNRYISWWELTRVNRKDLVAALIFGVRISLVVGILAVGISLVIGIPIGAFAGYYGGKLDIVVCRLLEIWESMPTFFMLLMVVAMLQNKSIFLVIGVIGLFGWTTFSRYIRGEFLKQRNLSYTEACHSLGFSDSYIIFTQILPNAIPPLLTLLPFAVMAAITSEAGLSFLGLGEEGSCSWGVLMDEGRSAFPAESYLLWPPAILLTILLVAIALVGDALRDSLDPQMHR